MKNLWILSLLVSALCGTAGAQATYKANWIEPVAVTVNADLSLTRPSGGATYNAGAVSDNILSAGETGSIQITYVASGSTINRYAFGFSLMGGRSVGYTDNQYTIAIDGTAVTVYQWSSSSSTPTTLATSTASVGDLFQIFRDGTSVKFYKNTAILATIASVPSSYNLRVNGSIRSGSMPPVYCTFDRKLIAGPVLQFPTHQNNDGAITLTPEGGVAPFTYQWSSGETTSSISGKARGVDSVLVTDAQGRTYLATYNLGYDIAWKNLVNATVNANNTLQATVDAAWQAGASSSNLLPAGVDGWVEFIITEPITSVGYSIGFNPVDLNTAVEAAYTLYVSRLGAVTSYEGNTNNLVGSTVKGDRFRISREGTQINYYRNGINIRSVAGPASRPAYMVDVSIAGLNGPLPPITTSFDKEILFLPTVTLPTENNTGGALNVNVVGAYTPVALQWSSDESGASISSKGRGVYRLTANDAAGKTLFRDYTLGYPVQWGNQDNLIINADGTLRKRATTSEWDAGAISANRLVAGSDGAIEFIVRKFIGSDAYMVGLSRYNTSSIFSTVEYGFYIQSDGLVSLREAGAGSSVPPQRYSEGSVFKIAREGTWIRYYINGDNVYSVSNSNTSDVDMYADFSIRSGVVPLITATFPYTPRTFYSIASGAWTTAATWSLSEGGAAATQAPSYGDHVRVKGHAVSINTGISCQSLYITATNAQTNVTVDGVGATLTVKEPVKVKGENNAAPANALVVQNSGGFSVQN